MGVNVEFSLAWLLQPLTVETFLNEIWGATHYHVKRSCPDYFDSLLPGSRPVDELLELFRPRAVGGTPGPGERQKGLGHVYRLADGSLDLAGVRNDFADGYTIVLDGVERYVRAIASLSHSIEVELNFATQVNAYITPPESQGFVAHYDEHDVVILQIQGSKIWHLYNGADVSPHEMCRQEAVAIRPRSRRRPTCAWRSATCFTCHAAESMRPKQPRSYRST